MALSVQQRVESSDGKVKLHEALVVFVHSSRWRTISPEITKKMDACITLTTDVLDLINKRLENTDITFKDRLEKERVRMVLNKDDYGSIFGKTHHKTSAVSPQELEDDLSTTTRSSTKRADAYLAAKLQQAKALQALHVQQAKLDKMKSEWKLIETQMLAEIKQKEAEVKLKVEEEATTTTFGLVLCHPTH